ncbi:hypothetical protein PanWU01x14_102240, partial [Parasponia andersonii]
RSLAGRSLVDAYRVSSSKTGNRGSDGMSKIKEVQRKVSSESWDGLSKTSNNMKITQERMTGKQKDLRITEGIIARSSGKTVVIENKEEMGMSSQWRNAVECDKQSHHLLKQQTERLGGVNNKFHTREISIYLGHKKGGNMASEKQLAIIPYKRNTA